MDCVRWGPATFNNDDTSPKQHVVPAQIETSRAVPQNQADTAFMDNGFVDEVSERDILQASLFGDTKPTRASRCDRELSNSSCLWLNTNWFSVSFVIRTRASSKSQAEPVQTSSSNPALPGQGFDLLDLGGTDPVPSTSTGKLQ